MEHARSREKCLGRLKVFAGPHLTEDHLKVLGDLFDSNELSEGGDGLKHGWFFVQLREESAPPSSATYLRRHGLPCFWTDGQQRVERLTKVFDAAVAARLPLIIHADAPRMPVMGVCLSAAVDQGCIGLGSKGRVSATEPFPVDRDIANRWMAGCVSTDMLRGRTWLIPNHEVSGVAKLVSSKFKVCVLALSQSLLLSVAALTNSIFPGQIVQQETRASDRDGNILATIRSETALDSIRATGIAHMCLPSRLQKGSNIRTGSRSSKMVINGETYVGSEVMSWAMSGDGQTKLHLDMQEAGDGLFFAAAVGTIRVVRTEDHGLPFAKQAIVVCAQDRDKVIEGFGLDLGKSGNCQYSQPMTLDRLSVRLETIGARFVVMNIPGGSSYILPPGCAHMFTNACLTEGSGWYPCVQGFGDAVMYEKGLSSIS